MVQSVEVVKPTLSACHEKRHCESQRLRACLTSSLLMQQGKQWRMTPALGAMPPTRESQMQFLAPVLAWLGPIVTDIWRMNCCISVCLLRLFCLSNKQNSILENRDREKVFV